MIIGIDASRANQKEKTGTEWYSYYVIEGIKKIADPNDQFILYTKEPAKGELGKLPPNFVNKVLRWPPRFLWTQLRLSWEIFFHKPEILLIPAHTIPLIHAKKTITTLHDIGFEKFPELYSTTEIGYKSTLWKKIISLLVRILTLGKYSNTELDYHRWSARFALNHAIKIITVSEFSKQEIINTFKAEPRKLTAIYSGYNNQRYKIINDKDKINQILKKHNIIRPFLLFIGRLEEKKNTARLVEAFGKFKQNNDNHFKLVLVGAPGYNYSEVEKKINQYNLNNDIVIPGWISGQDLPYIMNGTEIFVFPSLYEGFGIPILEAMACGTPVITSDITAMPEIADKAAFLVDPYNTDQIAQAIKLLVSDEQLRNELIARGLKRVKKFSWESCSKKTLALIKNQ